MHWRSQSKQTSELQLVYDTQLRMTALVTVAGRLRVSLSMGLHNFTAQPT